MTKNVPLTFDGVCEVDDLVLVLNHLHTLCVRVVPHAERTRNGFCILSVNTGRQQPQYVIFNISYI